MKVAQAYILRYGAEYLRESIAAVAPFADVFIGLYATGPSQGHRTDIPCPETEAQLIACFDQVKDRTIWIRGDWGSETAHRGAGYVAAMNNACQIVLQTDADEIWHEAALRQCLDRAKRSTAHNFNIAGSSWRHHWRSFGHACSDVWAPTRILNLRGHGTEEIDPGQLAIHHMSYAQPEKLLRYKMEVSGHRSEFRGDWFDQIWSKFPERLTDLHPVVKNWWNAAPVEAAMLPAALAGHPYWGLEKIN